MDKIALAIILLITCFILSQILSWAYSHLAQRKQLASIPGPDTLPFIGLMRKVRKIPKEDLFEYMMDLQYQYKNGLVLMWFATFPMIHIRKPHQMEVILRSQTLIRKSKLYNFLAYWLGNGLLTSTGDTWHKNRRLITPAFHFVILDEFINTILDKSEILNDRIRLQIEENPKQPVNIFPLAIKFTLDTVCETVMGVDMDLQRKPLNDYVKALHKFAEMTIYRSLRLWYRSDFIFNTFGDGKEYNQCIKTMHEFTMKVINEKSKIKEDNKNKSQEEIKTINEDIGRKKPKAFLDLLIDLSEANSNSLSLEEIREQVDTFMFGGHDTTGIAISWALFCLGNNLDIQKKVHEELDDVLGTDDKPPTKQQLMELKYLDRVIKEALRLYPSAPVVSRLLDHDVTIDDHVIPKDAEVTLEILLLHRDPDVWENPMKFDPDRFLPENSRGRHPYAYIPFSAGPRNCIGQKFAALVLKIALVSVLRKWTVKSVKKSEDIKLNVQLVLTPHNEILDLYFEPRNRK